MTKNWKKTGYLIPDVIEPEENICICVPVPKDWGHINAFLGQITELSKWLTWEKDGTDSALRTARRWLEITHCVIDEVNCVMTTGCGCGGESKPTNTRINPVTGLYEVSHDGGTTWESDPASDPRQSGTVFPPLPGANGSAKRCEGANSVVGFLQELQVQEYEALAANANVVDIITGLIGSLSGIGLVFAFVPAAIVALLAFVVNKFAHMIAADFNAEFTVATWDDFLCVLYCEMEGDGSFTEAGWQMVKEQAISEIGDYAGYWIHDHINLIGTVGLTNAARAGRPGTRECDGCECDEECPTLVTFDGLNWTDFTVAFGSVASNVLNVVPHTFSGGAGTGTEIEIDLLSECAIYLVDCDTLLTNNRPSRDANFEVTLYDNSHTQVGFNTAPVNGLCDGTPHHPFKNFSGIQARYVKVVIGWLNNFGAPNSGYIDNIGINYTPE